MSKPLDLRQLANKLETELNLITNTLNDITDISNNITLRIKQLLTRLFDESDKLQQMREHQNSNQSVQAFTNPFYKQPNIQETIKEQIKQIRSELYLLKDILDAITTRERLLLTEKNQLYKTLSELMTKLAQLNDDVDTLYNELEERIKKHASIGIFKDNEKHEETKLLEENPYEYARRFTDKSTTFDVDMLETDNDETLT